MLSGIGAIAAAGAAASPPLFVPVDGDTVAYYDLTPGALTLSSTTALATVGARDLTTVSGRSEHTVGPGSGEPYAREIFNTSQSFQNLDSSYTAFGVGEWTAMAWVKLVTGDGITASTAKGILAVCGDALGGDSEINNTLCQIRVLNTGIIEVFWEYGAGVNLTEVSPAGVVAYDTWQHIAVTKTVSGADATVRVYVDGALVHTSGTMTNATGGTNLPRAIVGTNAVKDSSLNGGIFSVRLDNVVLDQPTIQAAYEGGRHSAVGSTFELWQLDEAPTLEDLSGNGWHLDLRAGGLPAVEAGPNVSHPVLKFINDEFSSRTPAPDLAPLLVGDVTIEAIIQNPGVSGLFEILQFRGVGESLSSNYLVALTFTNSTRVISWLTETGSGVNQEYSTAPVPAGDIYHIALRRVDEGGTVYLDFFINGALHERGVLAYPSGTGGVCRLYLVTTSSTVGIAKARVSSVARSDVEIAAMAALGAPS